ncbi:hypothetical protein [Leptolyngbya sp. PCC 6406]|uniref:hypothetical protein n=1 Tax=Leptolyngbya sp. PCC 6406 TaxID=1173264 RepID=UPI0012DE49D6|nr:hypothetical protein [Leptolyngbya sp. PCC 6406]
MAGADPYYNSGPLQWGRSIFPAIVSDDFFGDLAAATPLIASDLSPEVLLTGAYRILSPVELPPALGARTGAVHRATAQLVGIVRTLYAPGSGWPADLPQTPEHLLPYVGEEAEELREALRQAQTVRQESPMILGVGSGDCRFADLMSWILWAVAASAYGAMALLEGVEARVELPGKEIGAFCSGVRLVPVLRLEGDRALALDLVTQAFWGEDGLATDAMVEVGIGAGIGTAMAPWGRSLAIASSCSSPTVAGAVADTVAGADVEGQRCGTILTRLWQAVERQSPLLASLETGWTVEVLVPGRPWSQGQLRLEFVLAIVPDADVGSAEDDALDFQTGDLRSNPLTAMAESWPRRLELDAMPNIPNIPNISSTDPSTDPNTDPSTDSGTDSSVDPEISITALNLDSQIAFTDSDWIEALVNHALGTTLALPILTSAADSPYTLPPEGSDQALLALVAAVQGVAEFPPSLAFDRTGAVPRCGLSDLGPWLRWWVVRTDPVMMALMEGMTVAVLVPGYPWETRRLGVQICLHFALAAADWGLDLITGEVISIPIPTVPEDSLLILSAPLLAGPTILRLAELRSQFCHHLQQMSPVLPSLMTGTAVTIHDPKTGESADQLAQMGLHLNLVLMA